MTAGSVRDDRRGEPRTAAVLAVALESETKLVRHGVTRDLSANGLLIVTRSCFSKGDRLKITLQASGVAVDVVGRVTRVVENAISSPELWRYRLGVALEEPLAVSRIDEGQLAGTGVGR